ncbi:hypothetical protein PTKIN_Ptkin08bG0144100 [Pterospermum kingtungense]
MNVPLEALAMEGVDYNEWGLDIEKWEDDDDSEWPPPHLVADQEEKDEEPERVVKQGNRNICSSWLTHPSEDLDGNFDDSASNEATRECRRHRMASQGRTMAVERIIQSLRSIKLMVRYMIVVLMIAMIAGRKRSLKSS